MKTAPVLAASVVCSLCLAFLSACQGPPGPVLLTDPTIADPATLDKLAGPAGPIDLVNIPYEKALSALAGRAGLNIVPNWGAMESLGITKQQPVTLRLKRVSVETALRELLAKAAGREDLLDYMIRDNVVKVSTKGDLAMLKYLVIYNVRDLRAAAEAWQAARERRYAGLLPKLVFDPPRAPKWTWQPRGEAEWNEEFKDLVSEIFFPYIICFPPYEYPISIDAGLLTIRLKVGEHRRLAHFLMVLRVELAAAQPPPPALPRPVLTAQEIRRARGLGYGLPGRRRDAAKDIPPQSPATQRTWERLRQRIPEVRFNDVGFETALNWLRDRLRVNVNPNWGALETVGIARDTAVSLHLQDVMAETALRQILVAAAGREGLLDWMVRDGVIKVSTRDDIAALSYLLIYNVRDIISALDRSHDARWRASWRRNLPDRVIVPAATQPEASARDDLPSFFFTIDYRRPPSDPAEAFTAAGLERRMARQILDLIRTSVQPISWDPAGEETVTLYTGLLIVRQTVNGHRELGRFLADLRAALAAGSGKNV